MQLSEELARRNYEAALTQYWFYDDGRDQLCRDVALEQIFERRRRAAHLARWISERVGAAITIGVRQAINFRRKRTKAGFVRLDLAGERQRQQRTTMKRVFEGDHARAAGVAARNLDGIFNCLCTAVSKECLLREIAGRERVQPLSQRDVRLMHGDVKTGVREVLGLVFNGFDNFRRRRANVQTAETARKIDIGVAVDILDHRPARRLNKYRRDVEWAARHSALTPFQQCLRFRSGNFGESRDHF